jgi:hypothetical protein
LELEACKLPKNQPSKIFNLFKLTKSSGCIISMVRLKSLLSFGNSIDPSCKFPIPQTTRSPLIDHSGDYVDAVAWTSLELAIAMICGFLPAIRNLLIRLYPFGRDSMERPNAYIPHKAPPKNTSTSSTQFIDNVWVDSEPKREFVSDV